MQDLEELARSAQFKNQLFPISEQNSLFSDPLCSESQDWGDIPMAFCVRDDLKTDVPSPGVPGSLSLNSGQENTLTELADIFALQILKSFMTEKYYTSKPVVFILCPCQ